MTLLETKLNCQNNAELDGRQKMDLIEYLKKLLCISPNASDSEIKKTFGEIAELLINHALIRRAEKSFRIEEIEFYYYNNQHRDLITYPRNTKPMQWYRNAFFGVDLTFKSKLKTQIYDGKECFSLDGSPSFGGILIRRLSCDGTIIDKPRNCANALFDVLDASHAPIDYPVLVIEEQGRGLNIEPPQKRTIKEFSIDMAKKKVESILWNNWYINEQLEDWMVNEFLHFANQPYKYRSIIR